MPSMSYCQFENTAAEMRSCYFALLDAIDEGKTLDEFVNELSSDHEREGFRRVCETMLDIASAVEELKGS